MQCTIRIHMDNAAFDYGNGRELARQLRDVAERVEHCDNTPDQPGFALMDFNGNRVGKVMFAE